MSSSDNQEGKTIGAPGGCPNPLPLGKKSGPGLRNVRNSLRTVAVPSWANSASISPGSCNIIIKQHVH